MINQRTICRSISCAGIGLHSGKKVNMTLKPAPPDSGICFKRLDLPECPRVAANIENVVNLNYATSLRQDNVNIQTVEHLLAAFAGLGIDNIIVELTAAEVPIMDGSAAPFVYLLHEAGIEMQQKPRFFLQIKKSLKVEQGDRYIMVSPDNEFKISYSINFEHPLLQKQAASYRISQPFFEKKLCRARTFGFLKDVEELRKQGLARGGSLNNALIIGRYRILNGDLRFEDEIVCHKIMDAVGDFYLLGHLLLGHIVAHKAGHSLHLDLARQILQRKDCWSLLPATDYIVAKKAS